MDRRRGRGFTYLQGTTDGGDLGPRLRHSDGGVSALYLGGPSYGREAEEDDGRTDGRTDPTMVMVMVVVVVVMVVGREPY